MLTTGEKLFRDINYETIVNCNAYYKRVLKDGKLPVPRFYSIMSSGTVSDEEKRKAQELADLTSALSKEWKQLKRSQILLHMRQLYGAYPKDDNLSLLLAKLLIRKELYSDAQTYLSFCCFANGNNADGWALQSLLASLAGDHGRALICSEKALKLGNSLYRAMPKAWLFTRLLYGRPGEVGGFNSAGLFEEDTQNEKPEPLGIVKIVSAPKVPANSKIIYFACDSKYLTNFGRILLASLADISGDYLFHIHIIGDIGQQQEWLNAFQEKIDTQIIISTEIVSDELMQNLSFLASCRFINAPYFMKKFQSSYLIIDTDCILNNPDALMSLSSAQEKVILSVDKSGPVWDYMCAAFSYFPLNENGFNVINHCSKYLAKMFTGKNKGFWYVDQLALFGSYLKYQASVDLISYTQSANIYHTADAIFWPLSNDKEAPEYIKRSEEIKAKFAELF